jgi:hypothetical protein
MTMEAKVTIELRGTRPMIRALLNEVPFLKGISPTPEPIQVTVFLHASSRSKHSSATVQDVADFIRSQTSYTLQDIIKRFHPDPSGVPRNVGGRRNSKYTRYSDLTQAARKRLEHDPVYEWKSRRRGREVVYHRVAKPPPGP